MHLYPGSMDDYLNHCARENARARREAEERARAEHDPALQCEHGRSLFRSCQACAVPFSASQGAE